MPHKPNTIILHDGRQLAYTEQGQAEGSPLFYFHGIPGSRLESPFDNALLQALNIRLIVADRPGYGLSDIQPQRTLLDWPNDIAQLADALQLGRFSVLGYSGGGAYALACADQLGERLIATGLISSLAPINKPAMMNAIAPAMRGLLELAAADPKQLEQQLTQIASTAEAVLNMMAAPAAEIDQAILAETGFKAMYLENIAAALHQGTKGLAWDFHLAALPWGFELEHIKQPVTLWHGSDDLNTQLAMGQYLAEALPDCNAHFLAGEGHCSVFKQADVILKTLMAT